jgi:hypothetical protein
MTKNHLHANETTSTVAACGRYLGTKGRGVQAAAWRRVTCLNCRQSDTFLAAKAVWEAAEQAAFEAQTPREFEEPWGHGPIVCRSCETTYFRDGGRSLDHYRFVCAECGQTTLRLTETGMSA